MATIRDVAREANVGVSTAWRAVNNRSLVRPGTLQRIDHAIARVGYRPRTAQTRKCDAHIAFIYTLEALISDKLGSYCRRIAAGVQQQARAYGMTASLFRGCDHAGDDPIIHDLLKRQPFDGVILFGPEPHNGYLDLLLKAGLPLVVFNRPVQQGGYSSVSANFFERGRLVAEHLIGLGHRRVAIPKARADGSGSQDRKWLSEQARLGFEQTLRQHDVELVQVLVDVERGADSGSRSRSVEQFCCDCLDAGVTALVGHDLRMVRCADQFERMGIRVPEQMSLLGHDDLGCTTARGQRLTATGFNKRLMGRLAVRILRDMLQAQGGVGWHYAATVPVRLIPGQTTGPVEQGRRLTGLNQNITVSGG